MKPISAAIAGIMLICSASSEPVYANQMLDIDVRGLKLGMTPTEIQRAIAAEGLPAAQPANNSPYDTEYLPRA